MKEWLKRRVTAAGYEITRGSTLHSFLNSRYIDLVVDAGANIGQFGQAIRLRGYGGRIWSFEPVSKVYAALASAAARDPNWTTSRLALGSATGTAEINVFDNHTLASILPGTRLAESYDGGGVTTRETISVETVDIALRDDPARHIMLKVDVQGYEREVLEGAKETLSRIDAIHIELPVEHLYEGNWSFTEAIAYMEDLGFAPAQFRTVNSLPDDPASAVEFDCLFRRRGA
ncbi:MAG: FkbM family methyltransferase [Altererythrobacter sp.]|nr:FkbM family methyltransferase [Altererythrobacter sp.]